MKKKVLEIIMEDGRVFHVPAEVIAKHRAHHYGEFDPDPDYATTYKNEFDYAMQDELELVDWYESNMTPKEVAHYAVLVEDPMIPAFEEASPESLRVVEVEKD